MLKHKVNEQLESEDKLFLDILEKLEQELKTQGGALLKEIEDLYKSNEDSKKELEKYKYSHTERELRDWSYYNIAYYSNEKGHTMERKSCDEWRERINATYKLIEQKKSTLTSFLQQYECAISLTYFKYFELPSTTTSDLNNLQKRYNELITVFRSTNFGYSNGRYIKLYSSYSITLPNSKEASSQAFDNYLKELTSKFAKYSVTKSESGTCLAKTFLSSYHFAYPDKFCSNSYGENNFNYLFETGSIISRMYLAIISDNSSLLAEFLKEFETHFQDSPLSDLIVNCNFVGVTAANGCINVMKLLIEMNVNLEQKFTISLVDRKNTFTSSKSAIDKHANCTLELTSLALALNAASGLTTEQAYTLVETLLKAGANCNAEVIKTWTEERGYHDNRYNIQKTDKINLFRFDQTGTLKKAVDNLKQEKAQSRKSKNNPKLGKLHSEIELLRKENASLKNEVTKLSLAKAEKEKVYEAQISALKSEIENLKSSIPQRRYDNNTKEIVTIQKTLRGYLVRKNAPLSKLKEERIQEVKNKAEEIEQKLFKSKKYDELASFGKAVENEDWHKAIQIIRSVTEQEVQVKPGLSLA